VLATVKVSGNKSSIDGYNLNEILIVVLKEIYPRLGVSDILAGYENQSENLISWVFASQVRTFSKAKSEHKNL
jgi:hypothetical protein